MLRRLWYFVLCSLLICFVLPAGFVFGQNGDIPQPVRMGNAHGQVIAEQLPPPSNDTTPGTWFLGATPPDADLTKPPIVFVQGLNSQAQSWWDETFYHGMNDMYETAYNHGYRTAFVQLHDAGGNPSSPWDNGKLLARMLEEIYSHFRQKVNIVAHSKGGPDTQAALVHHGAFPYVHKVVTLGSPHHGSHLADLAYSWWAGWLAELLGQKSDATYSLQTGEMAKFREVTDNHPNAPKNTYYTAAGTNWGPTFSALWLGGVYLSSHGENDGLVNVWSTGLPYGHHLFTSDVDHDGIRTGTASFAKMDPVLRTMQVADSEKERNRQSSSVVVEPLTNHFVRGGPLVANQPKTVTIPADGSSDSMVFAVLTKSPHTEVKLISPSGKVYSETSSQFFQTTDKYFFKGAAIQLFQIKDRESGNWVMQMNSPQSDAYLLVATFPGSEELSVSLPVITDQLKLPLHVEWDHVKQWNPGQIRGTVKVIPPQAQTDRKSLNLETIPLTEAGKNRPELYAELKLETAGTYNLTIEIEGKTLDGKPFARTIIRSVHVEKATK
ncbi:esterase/lipase family protein [Thermoactinomyces mirandus]|uniref:Uncharacterized protein n=1 Tax=Thermoactinomyces mirandus TaxID=2756294 RepID=A0A7W1XTZ4_9BACL|nr:hypothetical protein [Thermoactinomyces mirandus]MBA4603047.1 hypothetical protein [Thermoactinomyces mirandus]